MPCDGILATAITANGGQPNVHMQFAMYLTIACDNRQCKTRTIKLKAALELPDAGRYTA